MNLYKEEFLRLSNNKYLKNPYFLIEKSQMKLDYYSSKLSNIKKHFDNISTKIDNNSKIMKQILAYQMM